MKEEATPGADFSAVVCAYSEKRWVELVAAIESLQRQTIPPREVILVIDHNPELALRAIEQFGPNVMVAENREERGASMSRNIGVEASSGELIAFLDDDAEAAPDWLEKLSISYREKTVLGVGGMLIPRWEKGRPPWMPDEFLWAVGCSYRGLPETVAPIRNLIGANMSVRRSVFDSIDGFRLSFGNARSGYKSSRPLVRSQMGDEDTDLCIRAESRWPGCTWIYRPDAVAWHKVPGNRHRFRFFLWRCYDEGLGKARLSGLVGSNNAISSERDYTLRVLPSGVLRGIKEAVVRLDLHGLSRSGAIIIGFTATLAGYIVGSIYNRLKEEPRYTEEEPATAPQP